MRPKLNKPSAAAWRAFRSDRSEFGTLKAHELYRHQDEVVAAHRPEICS